MRRHALEACLLAVGLGAGVGAAPARADEQARPRPAEARGTYAGHDAAWWVKELRGAGTRAAATEALRMLGSEAIAALGPALRHHDPLLRAAATNLLRATTGSLASIEADVLALFARSEGGQARYDALALLARIRPGNVEAVPALGAALLDGNDSVRAGACEALRALSLPAEAVVPLVAQALQHANEAVRATAYPLVKPLGTEARALRPLLETLVRGLRQRAQLGGPAPYETGQALAALRDAGHGEPGVWPLVLEQAADRRSPAVASAALRLLASFAPHPDDPVEPLFELLEDARREDRLHLLGALGQLEGRGAPAVPWVLRQLLSGDHQVIEACGSALARIPPAGTAPAAAPRLAALLEAGALWPNVRSLTDATAACLLQELDVLFAHDASALTRRHDLLGLVQRRTEEIVAAGRAEELAAFLLPGLVGPGTPRAFDPDREAPQLESVLARAPRALARLVERAQSAEPAPTWGASALLIRTRAGLGALRAALSSAPDDARPALLRTLFDRARRELPDSDVELLSGYLDGPQRFVAAEILSDNMRRLMERLSLERQQRVLAVALERLELAPPPEAPPGESWALQVLQLSVAALPEAGPALAERFLAQDERHAALRILWAAQHQGRESPSLTRQVFETAWNSDDPRLQAKGAVGLLGNGKDLGDVRAFQARLPAWLQSDRAVVRVWGAQAWHMAEYSVREGAQGRRHAHLSLVWPLVRDPDPQARAVALGGLIYFAGDDEGTLATLRTALLDRTNPQRTEVAETLGRGGAAVVPLLVLGLDDPDLLRPCLSSLSSSLLAPHAQAARPRLERLLAQTPEGDLKRHVRIVLEGIPR